MLVLGFLCTADSISCYDISRHALVPVVYGRYIVLALAVILVALLMGGGNSKKAQAPANASSGGSASSQTVPNTSTVAPAGAPAAISVPLPKGGYNSNLAEHAKTGLQQYELNKPLIATWSPEEQEIVQSLLDNGQVRLPPCILFFARHLACRVPCPLS